MASSTSPKNQYLLEVGAEELPVGFLETAPSELSNKVKAALDELGVAYQDVAVYVTPRRMALKIVGLAEQQADREVLLKGPPVRIGLNEQGQPTQAALGFAKKSNIDPARLTQEVLDGEAYLVVRETVAGRPVKDVLPEILPDLVLSLSGSHFMRWGDTEIKFSRPIRWLVSLWNDQHLPLGMGPVRSNTVSYGHRVLSDGPVEITSVDVYLTALESQGKVMADHCRRRELVWRQLQEAAQNIGGTVPENADLLETVTMLVESPSVVVGHFQERFLEVPEEVLTTVMATHQKYFPVRDQSGKLMPHFLTVSNGKANAAEMIRLGNEKVITARFEDARFFFEEDQRVPLKDRLDDLKGVTFQKGLGTLHDKVQRLESLAETVARQIGSDASVLTHVRRAAMLAKADLVTGMVFEFTELQGVMGQKYARLQGEPEAVSTAIYEHYLPRFTGDEVARTPVGVAVSLADKLDTLVCVFAQENAKLPTGSKDPMGLRRMAAGVIQTVLQNELRVDLIALLKAAYVQLGKLATASEETMLTRIREFVLQRLKVAWLEENIRHDIIDAVLEACDPLKDLVDARVRLEQLKALVQDEVALKQLYEPANRIARILGEQFDPSVRRADVNEQCFVDDTERALLVALEPVLAKCSSDAPILEPSAYPDLISALKTLYSPVERFFEAVMVNDPDQAVRKNRYNLLSLVNGQYLRLAQFSKLVVS